MPTAAYTSGCTSDRIITYAACAVSDWLDEPLGRHIRATAFSSSSRAKRDVARLLDDVDPRDHPHHRLDPLVVHRLALPRSTGLLADQDPRRRHRHRARSAGRSSPVAGPAAGGPYAGTPNRPIDRPNIVECRHSSAISVSAKCVCGSGRVTGVDILEQQLHQHDLEPESDAGHRSDLVLAQLDALLLGQPVPQGRAESDIRSGRIAQSPGTSGAVPVQVDVGIVGVPGGRFQEPLATEPVSELRSGIVAVMDAPQTVCYQW